MASLIVGKPPTTAGEIVDISIIDSKYESADKQLYVEVSNVYNDGGFKVWYSIKYKRIDGQITDVISPFCFAGKFLTRLGKIGVKAKDTESLIGTKLEWLNEEVKFGKDITVTKWMPQKIHKSTEQSSETATTSTEAPKSVNPEPILETNVDLENIIKTVLSEHNGTLGLTELLETIPLKDSSYKPKDIMRTTTAMVSSGVLVEDVKADTISLPL
ncbi:MAG: hypothetical protein ACTSQY_00655 [Candidatus Odinarchaeia archaeon]